jgi:chemotaxis protein methyltransferase WspC
MMFAAVSALVRERIGLDPASLGPTAFSRAVQGRMLARGLATPDAYAGLVASDAAEWAALLADLVVHETWFFRGGRPLFDHLARWVRDRAAVHLVRVLSVPCSTGEEPYSLAIALAELGTPATAVRIDAADLPGDHLLRAEGGRFPAFSFREPGADPRLRHFSALPGDQWELTPEVRGAVRFRPGNLIDPAFLAGEPAYDLILCRNLFIYLTPDARARAVANLDRLLTPDGRLCLTPAEADRLPTARFTADGPAALSIFQRTTPEEAAARPRSGVIPRPQPSPPVLPRSGAIPVAPARSDYDHLPLPARVEPRAADPLAAARELADGGRLDEARELCERVIATGPSAMLFGLLGVIHLAAGRREEAVEAFRKALYLDPDHPDALTHMAVLCDQCGDPGRASGLRRRLARARREETA